MEPIKQYYTGNVVGISNLASLKRAVDKGSKYFWSKRGMREPISDFRGMVQGGAREGAAMKGRKV